MVSVGLEGLAQERASCRHSARGSDNGSEVSMTAVWGIPDRVATSAGGAPMLSCPEDVGGLGAALWAPGFVDWSCNIPVSRDWVRVA